MIIAPGRQLAEGAAQDSGDGPHKDAAADGAKMLDLFDGRSPILGADGHLEAALDETLGGGGPENFAAAPGMKFVRSDEGDAHSGALLVRDGAFR